MKTTEEKKILLKEYIASLGSVAVAFSGGVDSTFLLKIAKDVLGSGCAAITVRSSLFPERELNEAKAFCEKEGIKHIIADIDELKTEGFAQNPPLFMQDPDFCRNEKKGCRTGYRKYCGRLEYR